MVINLVGLHKVHGDDTGVASSLVNVGQEVGGSIGLAVLGTVSWSAVAHNLRSQTPTMAHAGLHHTGPRTAQLHTQAYHHALATGFSRGYLVSAGILALILVITIFMIRVSRADLSCARPAPAGNSPPPLAPSGLAAYLTGPR